ncbi:hypothetical protein D3C79_1038130 [compost metagenome]
MRKATELYDINDFEIGIGRCVLLHKGNPLCDAASGDFADIRFIEHDASAIRAL